MTVQPNSPAEVTGPKTVLVGISNPATISPLMTLASRIARPSSSHVVAAHIVTVPHQMGLSSARKSPQVAAATELLATALDAAEAEGVVADGVVEIGREVPESLGSAVETRGAELLLMGWSEVEDRPTEAAEKAFDKLMHSVASTVTCDLVVAKFRTAGMDRVLVPFAPSRHVPLVALLVRRLAAAGAAITFLHVVAADAAVSKARDSTVKLLEQYELADLGSLEMAVAEDTSQEVLGRAGEFDVIVIGAVTKTALAKAIFGSKVETITRDAPCSVVVASAYED